MTPGQAACHAWHATAPADGEPMPWEALAADVRALWERAALAAARVMLEPVMQAVNLGHMMAVKAMLPANDDAKTVLDAAETVARSAARVARGGPLGNSLTDDAAL